MLATLKNEFLLKLSLLKQFFLFFSFSCVSARTGKYQLWLVTALCVCFISSFSVLDGSVISCGPWPLQCISWWWNCWLWPGLILRQASVLALFHLPQKLEGINLCDLSKLVIVGVMHHHIPDWIYRNSFSPPHIFFFYLNYVWLVNNLNTFFPPVHNSM